jgi:hypothetical protein
MSAEEIQSYRQQVLEIEELLVLHPDNDDLIQTHKDLTELLDCLEIELKAVQTSSTTDQVEQVTEAPAPAPSEVDQTPSEAPAVKSRRHANALPESAPQSYYESIPFLGVYSRCLARWGEDGTWYLSRIDNVLTEDPQAPKYSVSFLQFGTTATVAAEDLMPFTPPPFASLQPGQALLALSNEDALFHEAVLEFPYTIPHKPTSTDTPSSSSSPAHGLKVRYLDSGAYADIAPFDVFLLPEHQGRFETTSLEPPAQATDATDAQAGAGTATEATATATGGASVPRRSRWGKAADPEAGAEVAPPATATTAATASTSASTAPSSSSSSSSSSLSHPASSTVPPQMQAFTDPNTLEFVPPARFQPALGDTETQRTQKANTLGRMRRQWQAWRDAEATRERAEQWKAFQGGAKKKETGAPTLSLAARMALKRKSTFSSGAVKHPRR